MRLLAACLTVAALGQSPNRMGAELGSPDYKPRRTSRSAGAAIGRAIQSRTPPLTWSRRVKGATTEIKVQSEKPKGEPGPEARAMEYFTIRDWLVADHSVSTTRKGPRSGFPER